MKRGEIDLQRTYGITYTVDPDRTFVVQPKEGELNYELAHKNPLRFYDKVMSQDVVEHKVTQKTKRMVVEREEGEMATVKRKTRGFQMTSRLTKRAVARILALVQDKLQRLISDVTNNEHHPDDVREALDHPQTKNIVQSHIAGGGIRLVDRENQNAQVFKREMSLIGQKGDRAANESPDASALMGGEGDDDLDPEDAQLVSKILKSVHFYLS